MLFKTTNHYLTPADLINAMQMPGRNYIEIDGIRLVCEDGAIHGWCNPGCDCSARNCVEEDRTVPSEVSA